MIALTNEPIDVAAVRAAVDHASCGGLVVFVGQVRDHADGRAVTRLEYEAYAPMAIEEMRRCVGEVKSTIAGVRLAVVHRVGSLGVGEIAVVCAAAAPHRGEAFAACHRLIDEIKSRVPIWKREHGPEGAYWVGWKDARCADEHSHDHGHGHGS